MSVQLEEFDFAIKGASRCKRGGEPDEGQRQVGLPSFGNFQFMGELTTMGSIIWLIIMVPVSMMFTGLGVYAWKRKKPMWFWSGSTVKESEISNIASYNRANGIMWLVFSLVMWVSTILGAMNMKAGGILLIAGCIIGVPLLPIVYGKIYRNYKK